MRRLAATVALLMAASGAHAQQQAGDALSSYLRRAYAGVAKDVAAAVTVMPDQDFEYRPAGAVKEVRTFGEIAAHLAVVNSFVCSMGDGKPDITAAPGFKMPTDKRGVLALLDSIHVRCTAYLATLTDATLSQTVVSGSGARALQSIRGTAVMFAIAHANEHYGNLVTYLRANGLVPPATPAQVAPFSFVAPSKP